MKIATFYINYANKRLINLLAPDIVCLQELKAEQPTLPEGTPRRRRDRSKCADPIVTPTELPGDGQSRN